MVRYYPPGPALLGHGRGRVLIFSTGFPTFARRAHTSRNKNHSLLRPPRCNATRSARRASVVLKSCLQVAPGGGGERENTGPNSAGTRARRLHRVYPGNLIISSLSQFTRPLVAAAPRLAFWPHRIAPRPLRACREKFKSATILCARIFFSFFFSLSAVQRRKFVYAVTCA